MNVYFQRIVDVDLESENPVLMNIGERNINSFLMLGWSESWKNLNNHMKKDNLLYK